MTSLQADQNNLPLLPNSNKFEITNENHHQILNVNDNRDFNNQQSKGKIVVAKQFPPNYYGYEPQFSDPNHKPVPITLLTTTNRGPRRTKHGELLSHTLLGDIEDFEELSKQEIESNPSLQISLMEKKNINNDIEKTPEEEKLKRIQEVEKENQWKEKEKQERKKWLRKLHIFQRYSEMREEKALRNWRRHSEIWNKMEQNITRKTSKKTNKQILMSRLGEYRIKIEEKELIEEALKLLESKNVNFWKTGIRIGSDLLGLTLPMPKGGPREIERLRYKDDMNGIKIPISKYRIAKKQQLKNIISELDPIHKHGNCGYMEIIGRSVNHFDLLNKNETETQPLYFEEYVNKLEEKTRIISNLINGFNDHLRNAYDSDSEENISERTTNSKAHESQDNTFDKIESKVNPETQNLNTTPITDENYFGIIFANHRLSFEETLNSVSTSVLTVYNTGSLACHFEWVKQPRPNPLGVSKIYDNIQRFFFYHKSGVILPNSAFDFPIIFKSASPGIFTETWGLITTPSSIDKTHQTITLHGIAVEEDLYYEKRKQLDKLLHNRQAKTMADGVIGRILNTMKPNNGSNYIQSITTQNNNDTFTSSNLVGSYAKKKRMDGLDSELFTANNKELNLYYSTSVYEKFTKLENQVIEILKSEEFKEMIFMDGWRSSVQTLNMMCNNIKDTNKRSVALKQLNEYVAIASIPPTGTLSSMLYVVGFDILLALANKIAEISDTLRVKLDLPLARSATKFFPDPGEISEAVEQTDAVGPDGQKKSGSPNAPPVVDDKKKAAPAGKDAGKKGAPAGKDAGKKAPPGKKGADSNADQDLAPKIELSKLIPLKPKRPLSSKVWSRERKNNEMVYKQEFKTLTHELVDEAITRMCSLFEDVQTN